MVDRVNQQLGNYRLIRLLGEGGFAEVYLGEHIHLGTQAAVKVLHTQLTSDDMEQFRTEARTIASLEHPHIVRILEFGLESKTPFLVMSYAPHGTLRQRHPRGVSLPLVTIVSYVEQMADALQYAHDEKLIHRDVKPENMLVGRRNEVLLSDFGIATAAQSSRYQSTQDVIGTVAYMAPEQIQGKPRPASDQYSLGIVVYEWISGSRPFHGSFTELCTQHIFASPPPLHEKIPGVSAEVEQVVLTALAKDPKGRFATVKAFATALDQAGRSEQPPSWVSSPIDPPSSQSRQLTSVLTPSGQTLPAEEVITPPNQSIESTSVITPANPLLEPTAEEAASPISQSLSPLSPVAVPTPQPAKYRFSRRTAIAGLVGLVVVSATGGSLAWWWSSSHAPDPYLLYTFQGHENWGGVTWSPDSLQVAIGVTDPHTVQVWTVTNGGNIFTYSGYPPNGGGPIEVAWSPNGKYIASGNGAQVRVWSATNGGDIYVLEMRKDTGGVLLDTPVAWSSDSRYIASSGNTIVQVWDTMDGSNVFTYQGHILAAVNTVAWSPSGGRIASGASDKTVQVWDALNGDNVFTYRGHSKDIKAVAWSPDGKRIASASADGTVQVWDASNGENVLTFRGHPDGVNAIAWSPDGSRIVSGGNIYPGHNADNTLQVWNAASGRTIYTYKYTLAVYAVAWSPDGTRIASGNGEVQVWKAP
ncbi:MAG TPA: protein kinase [Ktedonosporobacter sp.]|nr:protein kinase [Ktedonosporobacter sp.]